MRLVTPCLLLTAYRLNGLRFFCGHYRNCSTELLYGYGQNNAGGRPRMGSVVRRAHGNQCREKETRTIRRNEGNWPRSSANCLLLDDASGFAATRFCGSQHRCRAELQRVCTGCLRCQLTLRNRLSAIPLTYTPVHAAPVHADDWYRRSGVTIRSTGPGFTQIQAGVSGGAGSAV
jgi:hypothetical protein